MCDLDARLTVDDFYIVLHTFSNVAFLDYTKNLAPYFSADCQSVVEPLMRPPHHHHFENRLTFFFSLQRNIKDVPCL